MAQRVNLAGTGLPMRKKTFTAKTEATVIAKVFRIPWIFRFASRNAKDYQI